jgi:hypothetical protein
LPDKKNDAIAVCHHQFSFHGFNPLQAAINCYGHDVPAHRSKKQACTGLQDAFAHINTQPFINKKKTSSSSIQRAAMMTNS